MDSKLVQAIRSLLGKEIEQVAKVNGPHKVNQTIRLLGSKWYLSKPATRKVEFGKLINLQWLADKNILHFVNAFEEQLDLTNQLGLFKAVADQKILFLSRVCEKRDNHPVTLQVISASEKVDESVTFGQYARELAATINNQTVSGVIPFDADAKDDLLSNAEVNLNLNSNRSTDKPERPPRRSGHNIRGGYRGNRSG